MLHPDHSLQPLDLATTPLQARWSGVYFFGRVLWCDDRAGPRGLYTYTRTLNETMRRGADGRVDGGEVHRHALLEGQASGRFDGDPG